MSGISKVYKAVIAGVTIAGTAVGSVAASPEIVGVLPTGWGAAVAVAGTTLGTWLVWLKRNEPTVAEAEKILADARARAGV